MRNTVTWNDWNNEQHATKVTQQRKLCTLYGGHILMEETKDFVVNLSAEMGTILILNHLIFSDFDLDFKSYEISMILILKLI